MEVIDVSFTIRQNFGVMYEISYIDYTNFHCFIFYYLNSSLAVVDVSCHPRFMRVLNFDVTINTIKLDINHLVNQTVSLDFVLSYHCLLMNCIYDYFYIDLWL